MELYETVLLYNVNDKTANQQCGLISEQSPQACRTTTKKPRKALYEALPGF